MRKKILTGIIIILLLGLIGCESRKHKQIKAMMEVGEYAPAMLLLNSELLEDVKNVELRKMLLECYEKQDLWDQVIKQIEIIKNIVPETNYDFLLMRSYSLNGQFGKAKTILKKYPAYNDTLNKKYMLALIEKVKNTTIPSDSLKDIQSLIATTNPDTLGEFGKSIFISQTLFFNGDSLLEKKFYYYTKKDESELNEKQLQYEKNNHLDDWYLSKVLSGLFDDDPPNLNEYYVKDMLQIDSTFIDYIYDPLMVYANSLIKPNVYNDIFYYYDKSKYHRERFMIFKLLKLYKKALYEKSENIHLEEMIRKEIEMSELGSDLTFSWLYNEYIYILIQMNDYQGIIDFVDEKIKNHKKTSSSYEDLNNAKINALKKIESNNK